MHGLRIVFFERYFMKGCEKLIEIKKKKRR